MTISHGLPDMEPQAKERLYSLIDRLPEQEIEAAQRYLEFLCECEDPVLRARRSAPDVEEPFSQEEQQGVEEALRDFDAGNRVPHAQIRGDLGL